MAVTPQTNTTLAEIADVLLQHETFAICGHVGPDGDCLGSQLGLASALRSLGKTVDCLLARDEPIDVTLGFLPGADTLIPAVSYEGTPEVFIAVDVPNEERLGDAAEVKARCAVTVTIDHHAVDRAMSRYSYTDPDAASTTLLIWELMRGFPQPPTHDSAVCCFTGLVTDTGRFQFQNTDAWCFDAAAEMVARGADPAAISRALFQNRRIASLRLEARAIERIRFVAEGRGALTWLSQEDFAECDAVKADSEPIISTVRSIQGVEVACVLRDQGDDIRGSFRAKGDIDVAELARLYGGGGHTAAAGFTLHGTLDEAIREVTGLLTRRLQG